MKIGKLAWLFTAAFVAVQFTVPATSDDGQRSPVSVFPNENGAAQTLSATGPLNQTGPFFESLGTNGRSCVTCHQPGDNWTVTPAHLRQRFDATAGKDPIFRTNDGSTCDTADVSNVAARRRAYGLLLEKGLIRVQRPVPPAAEFTVVSVSNPYGCDSQTDLSVYRRILPSTNLRFLTTVMWDGRESFSGNTLEQNLEHQADGATTGHAQGLSLSKEQKEKIVAFEMGLTTAQIVHTGVGRLDTHGARGGALALSRQSFSVGINDPLGDGKFDPSAFTLFQAWSDRDGYLARSIARGEQIFNTRQIEIREVAGLNDELKKPVITGTCTLCHNAPNAGNHSVPLAINVGVADASRRTPDMPLFVLARKGTNETIATTDPGRALGTGKWKDIGKMKGPVLRGLSGRGPYFHNGSAATLMDVVNFYDERFFMHLTTEEKRDLTNFLGSL